jgi:ABC-type lipoprotein release transport system permease subunit
MIALKLAYKNLMGAGLRTLLNTLVLSFSFVLIILFKGMLDGWHQEARTDSVNWEYGGGQYWHEKYDPDDPFTLTESHGKLNEEQISLIEKSELAEILITRGTIYPEGRMQNVLLKGINPRQQILAIPSDKLDTTGPEIPAIIGASMARNNHLSVGDRVTVRWRDSNGTFDADEILISGVFDTNVPGVDVGQIWMPVDKLREMLMLPGEATILVKADNEKRSENFAGWIFHDQDYLLQDIDAIIKSKSAASSVFYVILLLLALLAIFDTQVLSIFRRQKEIGTYVAMGMTRKQVVSLFTAEGAMHSVFAVIIGAAYGIPLFIYQARKGINFGMEGQDVGITMAETLYPIYSIQLVVGTVLIIMITTTFVSFLPARKISKMKPTEAIKGKIQ